MTVIAELTAVVAAGVTMVAVIMVPVSLLNFIVKRLGDNDIEVSVRIVKGGEN